MVERDIARRFEDFVARLFEAEGFAVQKEPSISQRHRPDLLITSSVAKAVVEIKFFRSRLVSVNALLRGAQQVNAYRLLMQMDVGLLVLGNWIDQSTRKTIAEDFPGVIIYDADILASLASTHEGMLQELTAINREAFVFSEGREPQLTDVDILSDIAAKRSKQGVDDIATVRGSIKQPRGHDLCLEIRGIPKGVGGSKRFEEKMTEALKYIFETDLTAWNSQKSTETQMSFFDLVARIYSEHDFWRSIASDFSSRYVVFEFKNYTDKIKQGQIYTTEKYLYRTALRSTAFIISRIGADKNALSAARGALREHGKLIISLDVENVCEMLAAKDENKDYNATLIKMLDDLLMSLER